MSNSYFILNMIINNSKHIVRIEKEKYPKSIHSLECISKNIPITFKRFQPFKINIHVKCFFLFRKYLQFSDEDFKYLQSGDTIYVEYVPYFSK